MFRKYGLIGILLILFVELNFVLKIEPFASWYFPIIWLGYILILDAVIYKMKNQSLITNHLKTFLTLFLISAIFWWIFELVNFRLQNWDYGSKSFSSLASLFKATLSFSTVLPAFVETVELLQTFHLFSHEKLKKSHNISKHLLHSMVSLGIIFLLLVILLPKYTFPLVWVAFYFILDPINYLHRQPSIIQHIKDRKLAIPINLFLAGIILGFFWEFWNYYAIVKWYYNIHFLGFMKVFEMPILGYLGYGPFAFELYAMYYYVKSLHIGQKVKYLLKEDSNFNEFSFSKS
ncbi:MAG TPA: hypothetical protein VJB94_02455 [Candidatus Nanoarchaeia archaeon]|nr:hypothetical protein [Candidatus Nanoarchaeia archaeon]